MRPGSTRTRPTTPDITGILDDTRYAALVTAPAVEGVYYNKQVLADAGITETPTDFEGLVADARELKAQGKTPFYEMGADKWATQWWPSVMLADAAEDGLWERVNTNEEKFTDPTIQGAIATTRRSSTRVSSTPTSRRRPSRTRATPSSPATPRWSCR